ncbi:MAG: BCD family MFS transporter [Chloroflexota bacterium]
MLTRILGIAKGIFKTFRLALPKLGVGWMFALLTIDFNRITIVELGIPAILITAMLAMHYFLSPFQVVFGRIADRNPVWGYRRTPFLLLASVLGSFVFVMLPSAAHGMGQGSLLAAMSTVGLLAIFGVAIAMMGDAHHSLIAEVTDEKTRGGVISVVWTFTILSTIIAAVVMNIVRPEYSPEAMQRLYNLTPFIVIISTFLGVIGMEKRLSGAELTAAVEKSQEAAPTGNPLKAAFSVLRTNSQARGFFAFVFISIFSIFLQDNILEVFGAEVFNMPVTETTAFQQNWGGGVLLGMVLMGIVSSLFSISKRMIVLLGCVGTAAGMMMLAGSALVYRESLVVPALVVMGFFTGFFNVGALSMMMDMTIDGATGLFMGMWGMAQAFGNGSASFGGGALHTILIESGLAAPNTAYFGIFSLEALGMLTAAFIMWRLSVTQFRSQHAAGLSKADALRAMEVGLSS